MSTFIAIKDPQDILAWDIEWHLWLPTGETVSVSVWSISGGESPTTLVVDSSAIRTYTDQSPVIANMVTRATVSGGTAGRVYTLTNHITTSESQEFDRSITVKVWNR